MNHSQARAWCIRSMIANFQLRTDNPDYGMLARAADMLIGEMDAEAGRLELDTSEPPVAVVPDGETGFLFSPDLLKPTAPFNRS
jgi:hypothetical protein